MVLGRALQEFYSSRSRHLLDTLFRDLPQARMEGSTLLVVDDFNSASMRRSKRLRCRQLGELDYVTSSGAAAQSLAENYVGLPFDQNVCKQRALAARLLAWSFRRS